MDAMPPVREEDEGEEKVWIGWVNRRNKDSDLRLVSSDGYSFWVESRDLAQNSPVSASMLATCDELSSNATLHLSDPIIECAANLSVLLRLIEVLEEPDLFFEALHYSPGGTSLCLAQKYEVKSVLDAIKIGIFRLATGFPSQGTGYILVAARLKEWDLCGRLVTLLDEAVEDDFSDYCHIEDGAVMRELLDWRSWTPEKMRILSGISEEFLWAVCQTGNKHAQGKGSINFNAMGRDLALIMKKVEHGEIKYEDWTQGDKALWA